jgi:hypothetical protein
VIHSSIRYFGGRRHCELIPLFALEHLYLVLSPPGSLLLLFHFWHLALASGIWHLASGIWHLAGDPTFSLRVGNTSEILIMSTAVASVALSPHPHRNPSPRNLPASTSSPRMSTSPRDGAAKGSPAEKKGPTSP